MKPLQVILLILAIDFVAIVTACLIAWSMT